MGEYKKYRRHNKIYGLPEGTKYMLDSMLLDTSVTYTEVAEWLKNEGHEISRSTVGRYALENGKLANKLLETREAVRELIRIAKTGDGENMTEGALQIATHKLTEKIAMMDTEIDEMDAVDAIKLVSSIARTKAYKDTAYVRMKGDYEKAYAVFKQQLDSEVREHPELVEALEKLADETLGKAIEKN